MALQWLSLVGAMWLQSINGTNSNFPAYSSEFKKILSISQVQLNNLAFASDAGKLLGWISGVGAAHLPLWLVLLIGSLFGLIGYGLQFLFLTNQLSLSYWQVFLLTVLAGNSICWINTVSYIIAIRNFPLDRQISVGLSTSYVGLSAKIYTDIVDVIAPTSSFKKAKMFLLANSVLPLIVCIMAAPLARDVNMGKSKSLASGFFTMFVITIITGLFAIATSLGSVISRFLNPTVILVGMGLFLLLPLIVPFEEKIREGMQQKCSIRVHDECFKGVFAMENGEKDQENKGDDDFLEIGPKEMVRRVEFWLYFFIYLFGATLGLVYLNNLGQIAESRGCWGSTSSLVSLSSACGFFGRLMPSLFDYFLSKNKLRVSRAASMGAMMVPMCGAFFLLTSNEELSLYISTAIIGLCTGAITSISVSTTTEFFGAKNFGVNHNILVSNIPIGSFVFGYFAALFYRRERIVAAETCMGQQCYRITFVIWGSLCLFGTVLAFVLHGRTKKLYSKE